MKRKSTLIICACVCLVIFALYFIISSLPDGEKSPDNEENAYLYIDQTNIDDIIGFSFTGGEFDLSFEKDSSGAWKYSENRSLPINKAFIEKTLSQVELFLAKKEIARNLSEKELSEYGLDTPAYTLTLVLEKEKKSYIFGDFIESKGLYYASEKGSGVVYLVERTYVDLFSLDVTDFLTLDTLPNVKTENVKYVEIACGNYSEKILPNSVESSKFISTLCSIKLEEFVDFRSEKHSIYGLSESDAVSVYITYSDSENSLFTLALKFGLGETSELTYMLVGSVVKEGNSHVFSDMVYLLSEADNDIIYSYIHKAFSEK